MKKLFNFRPAVIIPLFFVLGIATFILSLKIHILCVILLLITPVICGLIYFAWKKKYSFPMFVFFFICLIVLLFGFFYIKISFDNFFEHNISHDGVIVNGCVDEIINLGTQTSVILKNTEFEINNQTFSNEKVSVLTYNDFNYKIGDIIRFSADVWSVSPFDKYGNFETSKFSDGIRFEMYSGFYDVYFEKNQATFFQKIKVALSDVAFLNMNKESASVLVAMIFGDKTELSYEILSGMRFAGIAHIFAVSGLHIGFFAGFIVFIFGLLKLNRFSTFIISTILTFLYCGICDFSPSSLRAFLMFSISQLFRVFGWKSDMLNSISLSISILLLIKPEYLCSYGFILSFSAVYSIAIMSKPIERIFSFMPDFLRENISIMFSAQIGLLPISVMMFRYFAPLSFIINFFVVPLISLFFIFAVISLVTSAISDLFILFIKVTDKVLNFLVRFISDVNYGSAIIYSNMTILSFLLFSFGLIFSSDVINISFRKKLVISTSFIALSIIVSQLFI